MPDYKWLQLLSINCNTIEANYNRGQVNEQSKPDKSKTNKNFKVYPPLDGKIKQEMDYFLAGLEKEVDLATSAKITKELHDTCSVFSGIGCFKGTFFIADQGR